MSHGLQDKYMLVTIFQTSLPKYLTHTHSLSLMQQNIWHLLRLCNLAATQRVTFFQLLYKSSYYGRVQGIPRRHLHPVSTTTITEVTRYKIECTKKVTGMLEWPHIVITLRYVVFANTCLVLSVSILKHNRALRLSPVR